MIKSMTGYGSSSGSVEGFNIKAELKSVNNRYLETSVRLPRNFIFAEEAVKNSVQSHISRGKVDVFITIDSSEADDVAVKVNEQLLKGYFEAVKRISDVTSLPMDLTPSSLARFPDILTVEREELNSDAICDGIVSVMEKALDDYDNMRLKEGAKLKADVENRLETIERYVCEIEQKVPYTVSAYSERLEKKMREVLEDKSIDESRLIQEVAIFADHIAVDEETVRLRSHIEQLREMISSSSPIGRKIDFLVQEFNREANTIGSKCQNSEIAHVVVDLKSEIEKIREQIQNIE